MFREEVMKTEIDKQIQKLREEIARLEEQKTKNHPNYVFNQSRTVMKMYT